MEDTAENPVTIEFAMKEKMDNENIHEAKRKEKERLAQQAETDKKLGELNEKMELERKQAESDRAKMQAEFEAKMKLLNDEIKNKNNDE